MLCRLNMQRLLRRNKHTITLPLKLIKELQQRVRYILFSVFLFFIVYDCKQLGLLDSLVCVWGVCVTHHNSLTVSVGCSIGSNGRLEYSPKSERNQGRTLARFQYQCPCALCVSLLVSMARTTLKTVSTKVLSSVACIIESHRSVSGNGTRTVPYSMDTHNIIAQLHGRES